jgi:chromosome segregation ATPase
VKWAVDDLPNDWVLPGSRRIQSRLGSRKSAVILVGCVVLARGLAAEGNSSLSESKIECAATEVTAATISQNEELRKQLALAGESVKTLTESLAVSNTEVDALRRKYSDLQSRIETLGLESASKDRAKLEQRLLNAVSDLRLTENERERYRDEVLGLSEAVLHLLKTSSSADAQARMEVETQLRRANELVTKSQQLPEETSTLMDGRVISVKSEWSLVVGNIGEKHGVKMGMPLRVMRGDQLIATLRVVDVRQKICGAVIQEMDSGKIKVGDRLQADARKDVSLKLEK